MCYTLDMRKTLNISISPELKREVEREVKEGLYSSVSEFFRDAVRAWRDAKLIEGIIESEAEFTAGKGKKLRSLRDLV